MCLQLANTEHFNAEPRVFITQKINQYDVEKELGNPKEFCCKMMKEEASLHQFCAKFKSRLLQPWNPVHRCNRNQIWALGHPAAYLQVTPGGLQPNLVILGTCNLQVLKITLTELILAMCFFFGALWSEDDMLPIVSAVSFEKERLDHNCRTFVNNFPSRKALTRRDVWSRFRTV